MMIQSVSKLTDANFRLVSEMVYKHCGIMLDKGKRELVHGRLSKQARASGFDSLGKYLEHVLADAGGVPFTELIDALSTNLTSFFREPSHFQYITDHVAPAVKERRRGEGPKRLLAWSAACSSGEEPYSMAITLAEALMAANPISGNSPPPAESLFGPAGWDVRILATDISTRMLGTAEAGRYPAARLKGISESRRETYFERCAAGRQLPSRRRFGLRTTQDIDELNEMHEVRPFLRRMVRFRHLNLMDAWPFKGPFDLIFCRNVMIYFDKPIQERLVNRFWDCLCPGGILFTGHSESLAGITHGFKHVQPTIYAKL